MEGGADARAATGSRVSPGGRSGSASSGQDGGDGATSTVSQTASGLVAERVEERLSWCLSQRKNSSICQRLR